MNSWEIIDNTGVIHSKVKDSVEVSKIVADAHRL